MAGPFDHVNPGDPLVIPAPAWNTLMDMTKFIRVGPDKAASAVRQASIVRVKNETDVDLPRNSVLGLGDPIFTPADASEDVFLREVTFRGKVPDVDNHKKRFCITLDPAPKDRVVRAYVAGVCPAMVGIQDESHEYAGIIGGDTAKLQSGRYGFAQILWREGDEGSPYGDAYDTGIQWCIVRLGAHCPSDAIGKANGPITARSGTTYGTGSVELYRNVAGVEDGPIQTVIVANVGTAISSGKYVAVAWDQDGTAWVGPLECE